MTKEQRKRVDEIKERYRMGVFSSGYAWYADLEAALAIIDEQEREIAEWNRVNDSITARASETIAECDQLKAELKSWRDSKEGIRLAMEEIEADLSSYHEQYDLLAKDGQAKEMEIAALKAELLNMQGAESTLECDAAKTVATVKDEEITALRERLAKLQCHFYGRGDCMECLTECDPETAKWLAAAEERK